MPFNLSGATDPAESLRSVKQRHESLIGLADDVVTTGRRAYNWYNERIRWTVSITSDDRLYDIALKWFISDEADNKPPRNVKASFVRRSRYGGYDEPISSSHNKGSRVELLFNETSMRNVTIAGHRVTIQMHRPEGSHGSSDGERSYRPLTPDVLHFYCRSREGQQAVVAHLRQLAADEEKQKPALHLLEGWGSWSRRDDLPGRNLESVVLRQGQMERLRDDFQSFLQAEHDYVRRGMPYHRGYMLYGPPGTGKTSIVRALAAHFGLDLWYAPLGDLDKDTSLMSMVNQVKPGSILLLEDIDVYHASRERTDDQKGASMAGLLNALDGVATPHGLITVMTTNDIGSIDPAILRPGRVDLQEEIGYPDKEQAGRLFNFWYDTKLDLSEAAHIQWGGSTADLVELFKNNSQGDALELLQKGLPKADERSVRVATSGGKNKHEHREGS